MCFRVRLVTFLLGTGHDDLQPVPGDLFLASSQKIQRAMTLLRSFSRFFPGRSAGLALALSLLVGATLTMGHSPLAYGQVPSIDEQIQLAQAKMNAQQWEYANYQWRSLLALDPNNVTAIVGLARSLQNQALLQPDMLSEAITHLQMARQRVKDKAIDATLAEIYMQANEIDSAANLYWDLLKADPFQADVFQPLFKLRDKVSEPMRRPLTAALNKIAKDAQAQGQKALDQKQYADAAKYFEIFTIHSSKAGFLNDYALTLLLSGNPQKADNVMSRLTSKLVDWRFYANGAMAAMANGKPAVALNNLQKAIVKAPSPQVKAQLYNNLGYVYESLNKGTKARFSYEHALDLDPKCSKARLNLAYSLQQQRNYEEAAKVLKEVLRLGAGSPVETASVWNRLGFVYELLYDDRNAVLAYKKAIELNPKDKQAYFNLGTLYKKRDRIKEADDLFRAIAEIEFSQMEADAALAQAGQSRSAKLLDYADVFFIPPPVKAAATHAIPANATNRPASATSPALPTVLPPASSAEPFLPPPTQIQLAMPPAQPTVASAAEPATVAASQSANTTPMAIAATSPMPSGVVNPNASLLPVVVAAGQAQAQAQATLPSTTSQAPAASALPTVTSQPAKPAGQVVSVMEAVRPASRESMAPTESSAPPNPSMATLPAAAPRQYSIIESLLAPKAPPSMPPAEARPVAETLSAPAMGIASPVAQTVTSAVVAVTPVTETTSAPAVVVTQPTVPEIGAAVPVTANAATPAVVETPPVTQPVTALPAASLEAIAPITNPITTSPPSAVLLPESAQSAARPEPSVAVTQSASMPSEPLAPSLSQPPQATAMPGQPSETSAVTSAEPSATPQTAILPEPTPVVVVKAAKLRKAGAKAKSSAKAQSKSATSSANQSARKSTAKAAPKAKSPSVAKASKSNNDKLTAKAVAKPAKANKVATKSTVKAVQKPVSAVKTSKLAAARTIKPALTKSVGPSNLPSLQSIFEAQVVSPPESLAPSAAPAELTSAKTLHVKNQDAATNLP
jgi:tetratricopeptide (TPR) repeat protein